MTNESCTEIEPEPNSDADPGVRVRRRVTAGFPGGLNSWRMRSHGHGEGT
jgi:hypothetical protein